MNKSVYMFFTFLCFAITPTIYFVGKVAYIRKVFFYKNHNFILLKLVKLGCKRVPLQSCLYITYVAWFINVMLLL